MRMHITVFLAVAMLLMQGCLRMPIYEWPPLEGRILDARTDEPIEGAFVLVRWIGYSGRTQCFHVMVATTNVDGEYLIGAWRNSQESAYWAYQHQTIDRIYAPGYIESQRTYEQDSHLKGIYYLVKDERGSVDRLEYLLSMSNHVCFSEKFKGLIDYHEAITRESGVIASSDNEQALYRRIRSYLDLFDGDSDKTVNYKDHP